MKIILLVFLILLSGCTYNLTDFVLPQDEEFTTIVLTLDTPQKICKYMEDNFEYEVTWNAYDPYTMWLLNKAGDCNDYATWAIFIAHYHGYEVYLIKIFADFEGWAPWTYHVLGVFVEKGKFTYSDVMYYHPIYVDTFEEIVDHYIKDIKLYGFCVYDYDYNLIEK